MEISFLSEYTTECIKMNLMQTDFPNMEHLSIQTQYLLHMVETKLSNMGYAKYRFITAVMKLIHLFWYRIARFCNYWTRYCITPKSGHFELQSRKKKRKTYQTDDCKQQETFSKELVNSKEGIT